MYTIECVIKNEDNKTFMYKSNIIPSIKETIIHRNSLYEVVGVLHYTNRDSVTLIIESR